MAEIIRASRPFSWINTAMPFLAMAWAIQRGLTPAIVIGTIYFLAPYNLLMYGVNDLYDYESDRLNPRKGGAIEGALIAPAQVQRLWVAIVITNVPLWLLLTSLGGFSTAGVLAVTGAVAIIYSMPPFRTKVVPGLDSTTSALHFVLPAVCGGIIAGAPLAGLPWRLLIAFFLWGMASHALGAIQDVRYDREAGIGSIAVSLGARNTAFFSLGGYTLAVLLVASYGGPALVAAAALLPYVPLAASCLSGDEERQARRAWHGFLGMNLLAGFVITQVLLRVWGAGDITGLDMLAWGSAFGILTILAHVTVNEWSMRRRAPPPAGYPLVSIIVPARNEAHSIGPCLEAIRVQEYGGEWETIVVDDESTDGTVEIAGKVLGTGDQLLQPGPAPSSWSGKCWAADHGARAARGDILLFLDADTVLEPLALRSLVAEIVETGGLLSLLTRYRMDSPVERIWIPAFVHMQVCFLPLALLNVSNRSRTFLAYGYGPCLMVSRAAYVASGGHAGIRSSPRDDMDLARAVSDAGHRVRFLRGADLGSTRHYRNLAEIVGSWRRTYYMYAGNSFAVALFGMLGITAIFLLPLVSLIAAMVFHQTGALVGSSVGATGLLVLRLILVFRERQPLSTILWHPITWVGTLAFQAWSIFDGLRGRPPRWRGRIVQPELAQE